MIFEINKFSEQGYILLESLFNLTILITIITLLYPLIVNWISIHREAKYSVEESRLLYENSMILNNNQSDQVRNEKYSIQRDKYRVRIKEAGTEVSIYECTFE